MIGVSLIVAALVFLGALVDMDENLFMSLMYSILGFMVSYIITSVFLYLYAISFLLSIWFTINALFFLLTIMMIERDRNIKQGMKRVSLVAFLTGVIILGIHLASIGI